MLAAAPGDNRLSSSSCAAGWIDRRVSAARRSGARDDAAAARARRGVSELDDRFGLHPALAPLLPLWRRGQLAVAQAVATPYRDKRSHFDGQDLLEAGVSDAGACRDGWLNRALTLIPGAAAETALSVGRESMLLMRGEAPTRAWSPGDRLRAPQ